MQLHVSFLGVLTLTVTPAAITVEGVASVAAASVAAHSVVAVLLACVSSQNTFIVILNAKRRNTHTSTYQCF